MGCFSKQRNFTWLRNHATSKYKKKTLEKLFTKGVISVTKTLPEIKIQDHIKLSEKQTAAFLQIKNHSINLLDGVTGSGKTEIYSKKIIALLSENADNSQALILLPEINLATHLIKRFETLFDKRLIVEWHSHLSGKQRIINMQKIIYGTGRIIIGARSAILLPYKAIKIIVVDEEHDSSYKQCDRISYNARDLAIMRNKHENVTILLCSATPSLETYYHAISGKFIHIKLSSQYHQVTRPQIKIINMRDSANSIFSDALINHINTNLIKGEQSLLFINKRGYASLVLCKKCSYRFKCINCSIYLTAHISTQKMFMPLLWISN